MDQSKIDTFVAAKSNFFTAEHMMVIKQKLEQLPDDKLNVIMVADLKNPTIVWVVSFFFGYLGIDRFLVGSIGAGIFKLLTFGGFGLWWLIDLFVIGKKARQKNFEKVSMFL